MLGRNRARGSQEPDSAPGAVPGGEAHPESARRLRSAVRKTVHRNRRMLAPWGVLLGMALTAWAGHALRGAWVVVVIAVLAIGWRERPQSMRRSPGAGGPGRPPGRLTGVVIARYTAAVAWLGWGAWQGVTHGPALLALLAGWAGPALWHWNRHRIRHQHGPARTEPEDTPEAAEPAEDEPDELTLWLRARLTTTGGLLPGATITPLAPIDGGRPFAVTLMPGKQNATAVLAGRATIASAAEVPVTRVVAETAPGSSPDEPGPAHMARITILDEKNPQQEIQEFDGPTLDPETGQFSVGPYPDGLLAPARLYKADERGEPMRGASGITAGAQGSGKSRWMEHKLLEHMHSGLFQVVLLDGNGGASIPGLIDQVAWPAANLDEWQRALKAVFRLMAARAKRQSSRRLPCWYATPGDPFVQVVLEEAHKILLDPVCVKIVKLLIQEGEKCGIGVDISTHIPSLVELGAQSGDAGARVIRDLALSGNVTLFRTPSNFTKTVMVGSVEVDPRTLPAVPGWCFALGASMRVAPVKAIRAADPVAWTANVPDVSFSRLDVAALNGNSGDWETRWERFAEFDEEVTADTFRPDDVEAALAQVLGERLPGQPAPGAQSQVAGAIGAVLEVLRENGPMKRAAIIDAVRAGEHDYSASSVDQALAALERAEGVRKTGAHGVWEAVQPAGAR